MKNLNLANFFHYIFLSQLYNFFSHKRIFAEFGYVILCILSYRCCELRFSTFLFHARAFFWLILPTYEHRLNRPLPFEQQTPFPILEQRSRSRQSHSIGLFIKNPDSFSFSSVYSCFSTKIITENLYATKQHKYPHSCCSSGESSCFFRSVF